MNTAKVIRQLQKVTDEKFIAAGKFVPRGVVIGTALGAGLGGAIPAAAAVAIATRISGRKTKDRSGIEIPRIAYVGVTDSEVVLIKAKSRMMVAPARPTEVLVRWPRSDVKVIAKRGVANVVTEFHVPGLDRPIPLVYRRLDTSAKNVVRLLSAYNHAHDRLSPVDVDPVPPPARRQTGPRKKSVRKQSKRHRSSGRRESPTRKASARKRIP